MLNNKMVNIEKPVQDIINSLKDDRFIDYTYKHYGKNAGDIERRKRDDCLSKIYLDIKKSIYYKK